jgi:hypothetical protein
MESIACDCWRIVEPLESADDALPDHIPCPQTQEATVASWASEIWDDYAPILEDIFRKRLETKRRQSHSSAEPGAATLFSHYLSHSEYNKAFSRYKELAQEEESEQPRREALQLVADFSAEWPLIHGGRLLGLVLRQWAQEKPSPTLANQLSASREWQAEVDYVREYHYKPYNLHTLHAGGPPWMEYVQTFPLTYYRSLRRNLSRAALPSTPATVQHLLASASGDPAGRLPTRGVLVTTLVYVTTQTGSISLQPNPDVTTQAPIEWLTEPLLRDAAQVMQQHRLWVRKHAPFAITSQSNVRKSAANSYQGHQREVGRDYYDHYSEALLLVKAEHDRVGSQFSRDRKTQGTEVAISNLIARTTRIIIKRRNRAELDPQTPPPDWTTRARADIRAFLKATVPISRP